MLFKDACNAKSNQQNLGCIKSSNLCTEIIEYTNKDETAVCNLASINLTSMVKEKIDESNIKMYTKTDCKYCKYSKSYLKHKSIKYEEINLDNEKERADFFQSINEGINEEENKIKTVPQIFINGERIGGFNELYKFNQTYLT